MTKRLEKERSAIARTLPQKQSRTAHRRTHRAFQAELHVRVEQHARSVATQTKQKEAQRLLAHHQALKQLQDNQELLIRRESEDRKDILETRFGSPASNSASQRKPTKFSPRTKTDSKQNSITRKSQSSPLPAYPKRQPLSHKIRAGLRVLLTFPTNQIKSLFGDGVT